MSYICNITNNEKQTLKKRIMNTQLERLAELNSSLKKGNVKSSINILLATGKARTGESSYRAGYAHKHIWTDVVAYILRNNRISFECGNDAPRGGANGEFVKLTGKVLKDVLKLKEEREARLKAEVEQRRKELAEREARYEEECCETYNYCVENNIKVSLTHEDLRYVSFGFVAHNIRKAAFHRLACENGVKNNEGWRRYVREHL